MKLFKPVLFLSLELEIKLKSLRISYIHCKVIFYKYLKNEIHCMYLNSQEVCSTRGNEQNTFPLRKGKQG